MIVIIIVIIISLLVGTLWACWTEAACHYEQAWALIATRDKVVSEGDIENAIYEYGSWEYVYDKCEVDKYPVDGKITGVLISS